MYERHLYRSPPPPCQPASGRRQLQHGWRTAVARAFTAAGFYLSKQVPTLAAAAAICGSNVPYVRAAIVLIKHETLIGQERVLRGHVPLLAAANQAWLQRKVKSITVVEYVTSWLRWMPERAAFGRGAGVAEVWDHAISPVISEKREVSAVAAPHGVAAE